MSTHPTPLTPALIDYAIKTRALDEQAIVTRTSTRRYRISPAGRLVSVITSPADQAGLWAVAHSRIGQSTPTIAATGDPTNTAGQVELFDKLGQQWGMWIETALTQGNLPQLIYANQGALDAMTWAATRIDRNPTATAHARTAAALVLNATHLKRTAGSVACISALEALREHYTTPLDVEDETHLGMWVDYPAISVTSTRSYTSLGEEETAPSTPLGKAFDKMHTLEGDRRISRAARIIPLLTAHLKPRHQDLNQALALLEAHPGQEAGHLTKRYESDVHDMTRAMAGPYTPNRAHLPAAIKTLTTREKALETATKTLWATDTLEQARGITSGDVLTGQAAGDTITVYGPIRARPADTYTGAPAKATVTVHTITARPDGATSIRFTTDLTDTPTHLTLTPAINGDAGSRWVKETWVNTGQHTATFTEDTAGQVHQQVQAAGGWGAWATSLRTP